MPYRPPTIKHPQAFNRSLPPGSDGVCEWDWILGAFDDSRCTPMDFDIVYERRGHFLIVETKSPGVVPKKGHLITFEHAWHLGAITLLFVWGKYNPQHYCLWHEKMLGRPIDQTLKAFPTNGPNLTVWARNWRLWAEKYPLCYFDSDTIIGKSAIKTDYDKIPPPAPPPQK